ncbi:MAG TPA: hypothetical protein VFN67_07470 [Polyangiales bacterium]|nr:hypothetical protein [Polyangiales bacterium]
MSPTAAMDYRLAIEELASNNQHSCSAIGNIVVTRSLVPPDGAYLKQWLEGVTHHAKQHPEGIGLLVLIDEKAPPPAEAERAAIKDAYVSLRGKVRGGVQVVEGEGFAAAAKRSVLMIINLATDIGYPIRVAGNVTDATALLNKLLGKAMDARIDAAELTRVGSMLRVRLQP